MGRTGRGPSPAPLGVARMSPLLPMSSVWGKPALETEAPSLPAVVQEACLRRREREGRLKQPEAPCPPWPAKVGGTLGSLGLSGEHLRSPVLGRRVVHALALGNVEGGTTRKCPMDWHNSLSTAFRHQAP